MNKVEIIGYACGQNANDTGVGMGPVHFQMSESFSAIESQVRWLETLYSRESSRKMEHLNATNDLSMRLALCTQYLTQQKHPFCVIGGDHSSAIGTWSGVSTAQQAPIGLIYVDAHIDAHTPETSPSLNIHGMPIASLLGHGPKELTSIGRSDPKIDPKHLVLVGIRSYEQEEYDLLKALNVRIIFIEEVLDRGLTDVLREAVTIATNPNGYGLSIDLDAFDPSETPGVSCPVPNGLRSNDFFTAIKEVHLNPLGLEIVEFNPQQDQNNKTEKMIAKLISALYALSPVES